MSSIIDNVRTESADAEQKRITAFGILTTHLLTEARGGKLTSDQAAEAREAIATAALTVEQALEIEKELRELADTERDLKRQAELYQQRADLEVETAGHERLASQTINDLQTKSIRLRDQLLAITGTLTQLQAREMRHQELTLKYWQASGKRSPEQIATTRHIISGAASTEPADEIQTLILERVMGNPDDRANGALLDPQITFVPVQGQSQKQMLALLETARRVVTWAQSLRLLDRNGHPIAISARYLVTDPAGIPEVNAFRSAFHHADSVILDPNERLEHQRTLFLKAPGETRQAFEAAMQRLKQEWKRARRKLDLEVDELNGAFDESMTEESDSEAIASA